MRWKMICKDQDWKYLAIVMILAFLYAFGTYNEDSLTIVVGILEPMTHEQLMMSISAFPAFALLFLFYRIMAHHETKGRWKTLLAFPIQIRKYVAGLLPFAFIAQLIPFLLSQLIYYILSSTISLSFISFMLVLQIVYYVSFFYSTFATKSGYFGEGISVNIVNPLRELMPIFLMFCILNIGNWISFITKYQLIILCICLLFLLRLFWHLPYLMIMKQHRELMVERLFCGKQATAIERKKQKQQQRIDKVLQYIFQHFPWKGKNYWIWVAIIDVSLKQKGYPLCIALFFMLLAIDQGQPVFGLCACLCIIYFLYFVYTQKKVIERVSIK